MTPPFRSLMCVSEAKWSRDWFWSSKYQDEVLTNDPIKGQTTQDIISGRLPDNDGYLLNYPSWGWGYALGMVQFFMQTFELYWTKSWRSWKRFPCWLLASVEWESKKHPSADYFSQARQVPVFLETHSLLCPQHLFRLPFIFHLSDVWHGWPTSHLKRCLGSPPFYSTGHSSSFPWLVPSLWLDLFMLKYLREVWAVFSFLIYLISGWAHPSPQSQVLCIWWWFPIFCL